MSIMWRPGQRRLDLPDDLEVPDDPEIHLAALRPRDGAVANALNRTLTRRRSLLTGTTRGDVRRDHHDGEIPARHAE